MTSNAHLEYQRTLALKPSHTKAINGIGWIYYNSGDRDAAISEWKKTLKVNPKDRDAIFNLAKAYNDLAWEAKERGRPEEAIRTGKRPSGLILRIRQPSPISRSMGIGNRKSVAKLVRLVPIHEYRNNCRTQAEFPMHK
jgi:tetratricopeptide (TPR) repeat protein